MRWASDYIQRMQTELHFLHVAPLVSDTGDIPEDVVQATLAKLNALKQSAWIAGTLQVAAGIIAETMREYARQEGTEWLGHPTGPAVVAGLGPYAVIHMRSFNSRHARC
jgi:hypothetical protein